MQGKISMNLSFCQSEIVFSLDGLVTRLAGGYKRKAFAELLKIILQMVQKILIYRLLHGSFERRIRTRVSCSACGATFSPLH